MPLGPGASVKLAIDAIKALEEQVAEAHPAIRVYRWRPRNVEIPGTDGAVIYNWISEEAASAQIDTAHRRDELPVLAFLMTRQGELEEAMERLEVYADSFREIVDAALWPPPGELVLGGATRRAQRRAMRSARDEINRIPLIGFEFPLVIELDQRVRA